MPDIEAYLATAIDSARAAGSVVAQLYKRADTTSSNKDDGSIVTEADMRSDEVLQKQLRTTGVPILSEESRIDAEARDTLWVIDPLDGTLDYVQRTGDFSIMIALVMKGVPVVGVVYVPTRDELYSARVGHGAYLAQEGACRRIHVSEVQEPNKARMLVSRNHASRLNVLLQEQLSITYTVPTGSNGIKLGRIAEGNAEIYVNPTSKMGWWDVAAPQVILEEAGGVVTDIHGDRITYSGSTTNVPHGVVAVNAALHKTVLTTIRHGAH